MSFEESGKPSLFAFTLTFVQKKKLASWFRIAKMTMPVNQDSFVQAI